MFKKFASYVLIPYAVWYLYNIVRAKMSYRRFKKTVGTVAA